MDRKYVVENWFGNWCVFCKISNSQGVIKRKLTDIFSSCNKQKALAKADLSNYIAKKAKEQFSVLAGA